MAVKGRRDREEKCPTSSAVDDRPASLLLPFDSSQPSVALTHDELAAAVGSTRVTVNKVLADFEDRSLVKIGRHHVDIVNADDLRAEIRP